MENHTCHWPGCSTPVPPRMWGCRPHWYRLPLEIRNRIYATYRPGQQISKTPSLDYIAAAKAAQEWIAAQEPPKPAPSIRPIGRVDEAWRRECEARTWIKWGHYQVGKLDDLIASIARQRGQRAADELRAEMDRQWARRAEWMDRRP